MMKRYFLMGLFTLGLLSIGYAQDADKQLDTKPTPAPTAPTAPTPTPALTTPKEDVPAAPEMEFKELVKPQARLTKRIFFVLDVSGSMAGDGKFKKMLEFVSFVCQQPLDDFEIAIAVFNDKQIRWDGFPSPTDDPKPTPKGWAKLPSLEATEAAQKWLSTFPGSGDTEPNNAMKMALEESREEMSIVLVTD